MKKIILLVAILLITGTNMFAQVKNKKMTFLEFKDKMFDLAYFNIYQVYCVV
ncbi:MAG: hypothetical protein WCQ46_05205 [Bacteroidales bacterium]